MLARTSELSFRFILLFFSLSVVFPILGVAEEGSLLEATPRQEGIYEIKFECREPQPNSYCSDLEDADFVLGIASVHTLKNTAISIIKRPLNTPFYFFGLTSITENGKRLQGNSAGQMSKFAEIEISFDSCTGNISGYLRDPKFLMDVKITGKPIASVVDIYEMPKGSEVLSPAELVGTYEGTTRGEATRKFVIYRSSTASSELYFAQVDLGFGAYMNFTVDNYTPKQRIVTLMSPTTYAPSAPLKWTLGFHRDAAGDTNITGMAISLISGYHYPIKFKKIHN